MVEPLRFGLVGTGAIAQTHFAAFAGLEPARLVAISDKRPDAARAAAESIGCPTYDSHIALAEEANCDAVIVCTPPSTHAEIVFDLMERGVAVLVEKPLCTDVETAYALHEAARRYRVQMTMASKFRFVEDVIRLKAIITSGMLGDILLVENSFTSRLDMSKRWNSDPKVSGGGVLIDNGTHSTDIIRFLFGPVAAAMAIENMRPADAAVEYAVQLFLRTENEIPAQIDLAWNIAKERETFVTVFGTHGTACVGWQQSRYKLHAAKDWVVFGKGYEKVSAFRRQLENFCGGLRGSEELLITGADAVASVEVIQAAYASLASGRWTTVPSRTNMAPAGSSVPAQAVNAQ